MVQSQFGRQGSAPGRRWVPDRYGTPGRAETQYGEAGEGTYHQRRLLASRRGLAHFMGLIFADLALAFKAGITLPTAQLRQLRPRDPRSLPQVTVSLAAATRSGSSCLRSALFPALASSRWSPRSVRNTRRARGGRSDLGRTMGREDLSEVEAGGSLGLQERRNPAGVEPEPTLAFLLPWEREWPESLVCTRLETWREEASELQVLSALGLPFKASSHDRQRIEASSDNYSHPTTEAIIPASPECSRAVLRMGHSSFCRGHPPPGTGEPCVQAEQDSTGSLTGWRVWGGEVATACCSTSLSPAAAKLREDPSEAECHVGSSSELLSREALPPSLSRSYWQGLLRLSADNLVAA